MIKNFFLNCPTKIELDAFKNLERKKKIKVVKIAYWTKEEFLIIKKTFPGASTINLTQLITQGLSGDFQGVNQSFFSIELKKKISFYEEIIISMMDRLDSAKIITYPERYNLYKFLICFWYQEINKRELDFFYSRISPHEVSDYAAYIVARIKKIKIINFTGAFNDLFFFLSNDTQTPYYSLIKNIKSNNKKNLKKIKDKLVSYEIDLIKNKYNNLQKPATLLFQENFKIKFLEKIKSQFLNLFKKIIRINFTNINNEFYFLKILKKKISSIIVQKSFKNLKSYYIKQIKLNHKLPKKYIYFLLPYQPECTNLPQGGIFHDIFLVISMLSKNIPKDWKILVKEHPLQFKNDTNLYGFIGRDINFYRRLLQIEKVILVDDLKEDHFNLIDNSKFVALINGTAGWEALIRNKKVIIFGEVFYSHAPNVFRINKSNQIKKIIKRKNIYNFEQKFINFVNAVIDTGEIIFFNSYNAKIRNKKFNYVENKIKIQKAIIKVL